MLSRLVEGEKWPVLTPKGEGVKAALLAAHGWNAALTMSDFIVMPHIRHSALDPALPWSALGDPTLLASPFRFPVRLTRKLPVEAQETALSEAVERARRGMIPVCGFISPAEHELERRLRAEKDARYIKAVPHGLRSGYDPSLEDSRAIADGSLRLHLAPLSAALVEW